MANVKDSGSGSADVSLFSSVETPSFPIPKSATSFHIEMLSENSISRITGSRDGDKVEGTWKEFVNGRSIAYKTAPFLLAANGTTAGTITVTVEESENGNNEPTVELSPDDKIYRLVPCENVRLISIAKMTTRKDNGDSTEQFMIKGKNSDIRAVYSGLADGAIQFDFDFGDTIAVTKLVLPKDKKEHQVEWKMLGALLKLTCENN